MLSIFLCKYIFYSTNFNSLTDGLFPHRMNLCANYLTAFQFDLVPTCPLVRSIQTSGAFRNWDAECQIYTLALNWVNSEHLQNSNLYMKRIYVSWNSA